LTLYQTLIEKLDELMTKEYLHDTDVEVKLGRGRFADIDKELRGMGGFAPPIDEMGRYSFQLRCAIGVVPVQLDKSMKDDDWIVQRKPTSPMRKRPIMMMEAEEMFEHPNAKCEPEPDQSDPDFLNDLRKL
jgi:hypothetical protein